MLATPIRTTIFLQPALLERLRLFSKEQGKPMSEVIAQGVRQVIEKAEPKRLHRMYDGLFALAGKGKVGVRGASQSIDEDLYGEDGAWKGMSE